MPFATLLSDAQVQAIPTLGQGNAVRAERYLPVVVDLSVEITIGRALLVAIEADVDLHAAFGNLPAEDLLQRITGLAIVNPGATVTLKAYAGATTHVRVAPTSEVTTLPVVQLWKQLASGPAATTLDVYFQG